MNMAKGGRAAFKMHVIMSCQMRILNVTAMLGGNAAGSAMNRSK